MSRAACHLAETIKINLSSENARERYYLHKVDYEHKTIERLINQLGQALTQAATDAFHKAGQHLNNTLSFYPLEEDECIALKALLADFSPQFEEKFRQRAFTILAPTAGVDTPLRDRMLHKDLVKLLCAGEAERILQSALQASYDAALRNYSLLLEESGAQVDPILNSWGVGLFLQHINPVNVSLVVSDVLNTLEVSNNAAWLLDRIVQLQVFFEISDLYGEINRSLFATTHHHI